MRNMTFLAVLAALLAGCGTPQPQIVQATVEVTRIVEVTRVVEATRLVEITSTPAAPASVAATPTPAQLQVKAQIGLFWASRESGQLNVKTTNESGAPLSRLEYHCTVTAEKTGELLADKTVTAEAVPPGETTVAWFSFSVKSEHTPGYFLAECESQGMNPVSAQFFSPGSERALPERPIKNGTAACGAALQNFDIQAEAYLAVRARYDESEATFDELARAYSSALMTYYIAVNACQ